MAFISEADVEAALLDQLEALGYSRLADSIAGPDGSDARARVLFRRGADGPPGNRPWIVSTRISRPRHGKMR